MQMSDIQTRAFTSLFNRVNVNLNATTRRMPTTASPYQAVDTYLASQGLGSVRLKRLTVLWAPR